MLFLSVRGFLDYAEPAGHSRSLRSQPCCLPPLGIGSASLINPFRSSIARPTDALVYASTETSRSPPQDSGSGWSRCSFPAGILPPLQHAGLARRTPSMDSNHGLRLLFYAFSLSHGGHRARRRPQRYFWAHLLAAHVSPTFPHGAMRCRIGVQRDLRGVVCACS